MSTQSIYELTTATIVDRADKYLMKYGQDLMLHQRFKVGERPSPHKAYLVRKMRGFLCEAECVIEEHKQLAKEVLNKLLIEKNIIR